LLRRLADIVAHVRASGRAERGGAGGTAEGFHGSRCAGHRRAVARGDAMVARRPCRPRTATSSPDPSSEAVLPDVSRRRPKRRTEARVVPWRPRPKGSWGWLLNRRIRVMNARNLIARLAMVGVALLG